MASFLTQRRYTGTEPLPPKTKPAGWDPVTANDPIQTPTKVKPFPTPQSAGGPPKIKPVGPTSTSGQAKPMSGFSTAKLKDPKQGTSLKYQWGRFVQGSGVSAADARDPAVMANLIAQFNRMYGTNAVAHGDDSINFGQAGWPTIDVLNGNDYWQWLTGNTARNAAAAGGGGGVQGGQPAGVAPFGAQQRPGVSTSGLFGGQVFTDPATAQWEQIVRMLTERLNEPRPLGYTDSQQDLINTQALNPLEQQRQNQRQQVTQQFASRGIGPGSGILEEALQNVDRQFNELRTRTQAGFAQNAIALEDNRFLSNEARALQGEDLFGQIPELADRRLQLANSTLMPSNPAQLLNSQYGFASLNQNAQQAASLQDQAFWTNLAEILGELFGA